MGTIHLRRSLYSPYLFGGIDDVNLPIGSELSKIDGHFLEIFASVRVRVCVCVCVHMYVYVKVGVLQCNVIVLLRICEDDK